jgi:hypothetical protein
MTNELMYLMESLTSYQLQRFLSRYEDCPLGHSPIGFGDCCRDEGRVRYARLLLALRENRVPSTIPWDDGYWEATATGTYRLLGLL